MSIGGLLGTIRCALESTAKKVKALLSVKEQVILVANDLPEARTPFAKGHELGHSTLAWHRQILYVCDEHDLNWATREQMEWEANLFSAEVLLPGSLVDSVYESYPTSMETVLLLHEWSGASIETCAIKYVGRHPDECALLVLDDDCDQNTIAGLKLTRKILSQRGVSRFGMLTKAQRFDSQHTLYLSSRVLGISNTEITIKDPEDRYAVSIFNNSYRVLALIYRRTTG